MAMTTHWDPTEAVRAHSASSRPDRPERRSVELTGHGLHDDGRSFETLISNLSYDGCAIATLEPLAVGDQFKLSVLDRGGIDVEVMWVEEGCAGLRFAKPSEAVRAQTPRAAERLSLMAEISLRRPGRPSFTVRACDISTHGCRTEFVDRPDEGEQVLVKLDGLEALPATACWIEPPLTGLKFERPIHPAVFDLLLARLGG
jgi:hypothetical protein